MKPEREVCGECLGQKKIIVDISKAKLADCPICKGTGDVDPEEESPCNGSD